MSTFINTVFINIVSNTEKYVRSNRRYAASAIECYPHDHPNTIITFDADQILQTLTLHEIGKERAAAHPHIDTTIERLQVDLMRKLQAMLNPRYTIDTNRLIYDYTQSIRNHKRQCIPASRGSDVCEDDDDATLMSLLPAPKPSGSKSSASSPSSGSSSSAAQRGQKRTRPEEQTSEDVALQMALAASRPMQPPARPLTIGEPRAISSAATLCQDDFDRSDWAPIYADDPNDPKGKKEATEEDIIAYHNINTDEEITPAEYQRRCNDK